MLQLNASVSITRSLDGHRGGSVGPVGGGRVLPTAILEKATIEIRQVIVLGRDKDRTKTKEDRL
jgi:hypothetical protein